jgi:hypothetical protein
MKRNFWLILSLLVLALFLMTTPLVSAQNATIQIMDQNVKSQFRDNITAELTAEHASEITNVEFFYRVVGQRATNRNVAEFEPGKTIKASYSIDQTQNDTYMPPGTELEYWWRLTDAEGNTLKTEPELYLYLDNRFDFKTLHNDRLTLYWYNGGRAFGEALFEQANKGLDQLEEDIGVSLERPIKIFIYGTQEDLISALSLSAQEWTGGVAYTDYGVVVIGIRADNLDWGLRAMTHEMTHLVIHQATDNPYGDLPRWLDEGLAVYNEDPERLDEQFQETFNEAVANNSLMTLQTLSSTFPADPMAANLAYGESGAVVGFIIHNYGSDAMKDLLEIFSEGSLYDDALEQALGEDTQSLDNAFRTRLGLPPLPGTETSQTESQQTEAQKSDTEATESEVTKAEQPETQAGSGVAVVEEKSAPTEQASETPSRRRGLQCLGGLLPLAALGVVIARRKRKQLF